MKKSALLLGILVLFSILQSCSNDVQKDVVVSTKDGVMQYEFDKNYTFTGTVELLPNTSETEMKSYILVLEKPINITSKNPEHQNQECVEEVLFSFSNETIEIEKYKGKKITVSGTLTASESIHEKRPVGIFNAILK